jgi:acyl carrier protein
MSETLAKLKSIVREQLGIDESKIVPEATFTHLGADSLDVVELVMAFEEEFDIEIDDDSASTIQTVQSAVDFIDKKLDELSN